MSRKLLAQHHIHPAIQQSMGAYHAGIVEEVEAAIAQHQVVVVGMRLNPFPTKARRLLDKLGTPYTYLEYGSYLSQWKPRLALKLWSGWPTFPMVFVNGTLVGGATELQRLVDDGQFGPLLVAPRQG